MAVPGKVVAAALSATSEITAALANINFDFSLIKVEAPQEFAIIGKSLTKRRKVEAEDGLSHTVARKLAALFYGDLPETPALLAAYGERASEIISSPKANPRGGVTDGPFAAYVGAEATTLWAAATSGKEAIAVHLLACLLARIWPAAEAVSIWMELIKQRKQRIEKDIEAGSALHAGSTFAARVEITRDYLTDLDAGTRAWLRTADRIKEVQQTQLRLIIDNVSIPVSNHSSTYETVMEAWKGSMVLMDDLITGKPQRVQSGALLLGLSAWHLYPDMSVPGSCNSYVKQGDPLISPGGIATIGLQDRPDTAGRGVHWSMPLNHLKYYGKPEVKTRYSGIAENRVTFDEYLYVAVGSIFSTWRAPSVSTGLKISLLAMVATHFQNLASWLKPIKLAAERYQSLSETEKNKADRLIALGMRHSPSMLASPHDHPKPALGLVSLPVLLSLCKDVQSRIELLRLWAEPQRDRLQNAVIRYFLPSDDAEQFIFLFPRSGKKRKRGIAEEDHWVHKRRLRNRPTTVESRRRVLEEVATESGTTRILNRSNPSHPGPDQRDANAILFQAELSQDDEDIQFDIDGLYFVTVADQIRACKFLAGETHLAAILVPIETSRNHRYHNELSIVQLHNIFLNNKLLTTNEAMLKAFWLLEPRCMGKVHAYRTSLQTLSMASECYAGIPEAQVALQAREIPLSTCPFGAFSDGNMWDAPELVFSCIAYFETGYAQIPLTDLHRTMAICYQDSMYVSERLLCDPFEHPRSQHALVRRIVGNIGKPGLCILQAPPFPEVREYDPVESWNVVNHHEFDGKYENNFTSTSLHLSFTGSVVSPSWNGPAAGNVKGAVHRDIHYLETLISVYDSCSWIADLDILDALDRFQFGWDPTLYNEQRDTLEKRLTMADCWNEILDPVGSDCVVRAADNWVARLTVATVLVQLGHSVRVISPSSRPKYDPVKTTDSDENMAKPNSSQTTHSQAREVTPDFSAVIGNAFGLYDLAMNDFDFSSESEDDASTPDVNDRVDVDTDRQSFNGTEEKEDNISLAGRHEIQAASAIYIC